MAAEADDPQQCSHGRHRLGQQQIKATAAADRRTCSSSPSYALTAAYAQMTATYSRATTSSSLDPDLSQTVSQIAAAVP
jgi:hypothetical protein